MIFIADVKLSVDDIGHNIQSAISGNPVLHANTMDVFYRTGVGRSKFYNAEVRKLLRIDAFREKKS